MKMILWVMIASLLCATSCNNKKEITAASSIKATDDDKEQRNKQTALASINALLAGNIEEALKDAAPDITDHNNGSMPPVRGIDSVKAMMHQWRDSMGDYKGEHIWAIAEGDHVAVFGTWSSTFTSDIGSWKTAGKTVKINDVDVFTFNEAGKIVEHRSVQSSAEMMKQLGSTATR